MIKLYILLLITVLNVTAKLPTEFIGRPATEKYKNLRFQCQLDFRNSFLGKNAAPINVYGVNIGLKHKEKFRYGIGFYFISQISKREVAANDLGKQIKLINGEYTSMPTYFANRNLLLYYGTINFTYSIIKNRYFDLDIPVEIGFGHYAYQLENIRINSALTFEQQLSAESKIDQRKLTKNRNTGTFVPILVGLATTVKLHRWVYPQLSGGFRKSVLESDFKADFDGFYYHIGFQIHFAEIYQDIFKKKPPISF